ncbi:type 2 DNA topoisomerase 6 subunit B-like isoform X2 [Balearica regulorum gibbericeps]|uniref:type 2 DNA topoisomerase 6 subunit B-like isoform X2 n=1 Tax=Balearica regulorum gibbericeps TaxID=100784 RepID=UPI003F5E32C0
MAGEAVRAVLERLFLGLRPPESGEQRRGSLLVALVAEGDTGRARCTVTVAAAGELSCGVGAEALRGAPRGVLELPGVPRAPAPCCGRILHQARLRLTFQLSPRPSTLSSDCAELRRFLHKTSAVYPEVEFHFCVSVNGAVASHTYGQESAGALPGARLRVQSRHFAPPAEPGGAPRCSRIHPALGTPIRLRVPPPAAAVGLGGELSVLPAAALCPCHRPAPNLPTRLAAVALFLYDPVGLPAAPPLPRLFQDPSWLTDWERFGFTAAPRTPPEGEEELVTPDATYVVRQGAGAPVGDRHPQTLLLFLFLRHDDPFQAYDAGARRLLLAHLDQTLLSSRPALTRGLRTLVHPALEELRRRHESQERLARSLPVVLDAVTAVVTGSTSARFRRTCLRTMQVEDTAALAAAARRSLAEVTQRCLLPCASCETPGAPGDPRRGEGRAREGGTRHPPFRVRLGGSLRAEGTADGGGGGGGGGGRGHASPEQRGAGVVAGGGRPG